MKQFFLLSLMTVFIQNSSAKSFEFNADNCIDGQDLYAEDIDISNCPELPKYPESTYLGDSTKQIDLGAWELGETSEGLRYKYGSLTNETSTETRLNFEGTSTLVNNLNLACWAKGYYRLRKILQDPPKSYITLHAAGFQYRFFQFQTDLRNGPTGFKEISSYMDHLIKWVTVITEDGTCIQPTLGRFEAYLQNELTRRGL